MKIQRSVSYLESIIQGLIKDLEKYAQRENANQLYIDKQNLRGLPHAYESYSPQGVAHVQPKHLVGRCVRPKRAATDGAFSGWLEPSLLI